MAGLLLLLLSLLLCKKMVHGAVDTSETRAIETITLTDCQLNGHWGLWI